MLGGTPDGKGARHTPLTTVPEDSDEDRATSPTARGSPETQNPGRHTPLAAPGARHDAASRIHTLPMPDRLQPPEFLKDFQHTAAPLDARRTSPGAISPLVVRGGLQVPKFLEEQRGLGAVSPPECRPARHGPPQPPSFLRSGLGLPSPPNKAETRPRSVEPPEFLQERLERTGRAPDLRSRSVDDVTLERNVRASISPLSSPLREISAESVSSAPLLDESGRDDSKEVVSKEVTACFKAAKVGNVRKVQAALESGMVLMTARNNRNDTLLHTAARYGQHELVTLLLSKGADAAAVDAKRRMPAQLAARHKQKFSQISTLVHLLCKRGEFLTCEHMSPPGVGTRQYSRHTFSTVLCGVDFWNNVMGH